MAYKKFGEVGAFVRRPDLLQSSLEADGKIEPLYSINSMFWVGFMGGGLGLMLYSFFNLYNMKRLSKDFLLPIISISIYFALLFTFFWDNSISDKVSSSIFKVLSRIWAMIYLGIFYFKFKTIFRLADSYKMPSASPWIPAIACSLMGTVINIIIFISIRH